VDGRFVLLGFIVALAGFTARNLQPVRPAGALAAEQAQERAIDTVLIEVDRAQLCYARRRAQYADTVPSLQITGGPFMRVALQHDLDITLSTADGGRAYEASVRGAGIHGVIGRRGPDLVRLDVGDRRAPVPVAGSPRCAPAAVRRAPAPARP
jgi:hypothetical protein